MLKKIFGTLAVLIFITAPIGAAQHAHSDIVGDIIETIGEYKNKPACAYLLDNLENNKDDLRSIAQDEKRRFIDSDAIGAIRKYLGTMARNEWHREDSNPEKECRQFNEAIWSIIDPEEYVAKHGKFAEFKSKYPQFQSKWKKLD